MHTPWVYVAWIRDHQLAKDDQDGEYPCVIIIEAATESDAKNWGDKLYYDALSNDKFHSFLCSEIHTQDDPRYESGNSKELYNWKDVPRCTVNQRLSIDLLY